ncbi:MAG: portal protein [Micavibrio sp.]
MNLVSLDRIAPDAAALETLRRRYDSAKARRSQWESLWQDAYEYALPQRQGFGGGSREGDSRMDRLYDGTALDAVEQLGASLLGNLMPPWTQWFGLKPGPDLTPAESESLAPVLEKAARTIQAHFDRSNFIVEIHQCFLDLIVGGTAALYVEEAEPGAFSAFKFTAVPLHQIVLEEGGDGFLNGSFREIPLTLEQLQTRYPKAAIPDSLLRDGERDPQRRFTVLEGIIPDQGRFLFTAMLADGPVLLKQTSMTDSPVIAFRWLKSPGEIYGRSPVMKALPDIKTANKVVELILKNASIAVTGIWQADDDGVLNPANIELKPGSIIPKAVGSQGLKPLEMPGRFDISQLVLDDLRARIRHALLADKLVPITSRRMTATEVLERSAEMALLLGATYGRLQTELMTPLIQRAYAILRRRGEVPDVNIDGRLVTLDYRSPLARAQGQRNVQNTLFWIESVQAMGPAALAAVNLPQAARLLGDALGVPSDLILNDLTTGAMNETLPYPETGERPGASAG